MAPCTQLVNTNASWQQKHDERVAQMKCIIHDIRNIYNANTPLFTKEAIRKAGEQLESCRKGALGGRNVVLQGINGIDYESIICPPPVQDTPDPTNKEQHVEEWTWVISYKSIERLTNVTNVNYFPPETAYLPMVITTCTMEISPHHPIEDGVYVSSTEELREAFCQIERNWRMSEHYEQLQAALAAVKTPLGLDKVIGVALGPLILRRLVNHKSIIQHSLISALHSILLRSGVLSASSKCYVQDPIYTQQDRQVLGSTEFTVLDDPQAFLMLDNSSVLVSIYPNVPVKQIVADICRPGIIIWPRRFNVSYPITDPNSSRVDEMLEKDYYELDFPFHESFGNLVMYIRKVA
ncbi:hypothetical protein F4859DRAFT_486577 [Xylaria cf. heliscus]|nr:hypothetical protein F4859DRAFT_486577 [Xylaria cf. heliscus]